jgi:hypothetical protein
MATRKKSARKGARKGATRAKRGSGKRDLIAPRGDKRYVRRTASGQFRDEQDNVGRSLSRDVRKKAKRTAKAGRGDEGDERRGATAKRKRGTGGAKRKTSARRKTGRKRATARR